MSRPSASMSARLARPVAMVSAMRSDACSALQRHRLDRLLGQHFDRAEDALGSFSGSSDS